MLTVYFEQIHPFILFLFLPFFQCLVGFAIPSSYVWYECNVLPSSLPLVCIPFPPRLPLISPFNSPPYRFMCYYHHHHHPCRSRFHKWPRTCDIWLFYMYLCISYRGDIYIEREYIYIYIYLIEYIYISYRIYIYISYRIYIYHVEYIYIY
jgi:hypothetical protein